LTGAQSPKLPRLYILFRGIVPGKIYGISWDVLIRGMIIARFVKHLMVWVDLVMEG